MPELPDIEVYLDALRPRLQGQPLEAVRLGSPFLLRTVEPPLASLSGRRVTNLRRLGKPGAPAHPLIRIPARIATPEAVAPRSDIAASKTPRRPRGLRRMS